MGGGAKIVNSAQKAESVRFQSSMQGGCVPLLHGTHRVPPNLIEYGNFRSVEQRSTESAGGKGGGGGVKTTTIWFTYYASVAMALVEGPILGTGKKWVGKQVYEAGTGPSSADLGAYFGTVGQPAWPVLATMHNGEHNIGYSGLAYYYIEDYELGTEAEVLNHAIEVYGPGTGTIHSSVWDADCGIVFGDWVSSDRRGLGVQGVLADLSNYQAYCRASGIWLSPLLLEQAAATDRFNMLQRVTNSAIVEMDGYLHMVPLGAEDLSFPLVRPGVGLVDTFTWAADTAPLYDLTPDHLLPRGDDEPLVAIERKTPADAYNIVEVEFRNRALDYAPDVARQPDQASIDLYGPKPAPKLVCDWICEADVAARIAQQELNRHLQILNKYTFELPWSFSDIVPTTVLRLTSPDQGLDAYPVRVTRMDEMADGYKFTAEDFPASISAQPVHELPVVSSYKNDYGAVPGDAEVLAVMEAPSELANGELELWVAVAGSGSAWGGCHIWVSADGLEYKQVTTVLGKSRSGVLPSAVLSNATSIDVDQVNGQLLSGSALDATLGATLCYIGGSKPEYFAYTTAALTGAGAYTLGGAVRGIYGTSARPHLAGEAFVRCDDALGKSGPLSLQLIGRDVFIKCQSFNVFGLQTQDLADIDPVTYTVTGRFALGAADASNLITQGDFSVLPVGERPSDWAAGLVVAVAGQPFTGALQCSATYTESLTRFPAAEGNLFFVSGRVNGQASTVTTSLGVRWYDSSGAPLSFSTAGGTLAAGAVWTARTGVVTAPPNAAYGVAGVQRGAGAAGTCLLASVRVIRQVVTHDVADGAVAGVQQVYLAYGTALALSATPTYAVAVEAGYKVLIHMGGTWEAYKDTAGTAAVRGYTQAVAGVSGGSLVAVGSVTDRFRFATVLSQGQSASGFISRTFQYEVTAGGTLSVFGRCGLTESSSPPTMDNSVYDLKLDIEVIKK